MSKWMNEWMDEWMNEVMKRTWFLLSSFSKMAAT